jgi:hypothetical protein
MGEGAMKKLVVALVIGCIIFGAGCTGPFKLTKRIHDWQTSFDSKWVDELAFLGCAILPVYGAACKTCRLRLTHSVSTPE